MSASPKIERRYRGLSREELGRVIRREAREALRIIRPKIKPGAKAKRPGPDRSERGIPSPNMRAVSKAAVVKLPYEPADPAKALIAQRESICARCEHFNGVCTLVFPQVRGCRSLVRHRPGWLAFAADAENVCPLGWWAAEQAQVASGRD